MACVTRLRERRSRGMAMVAPVEVGEGGVDLLVNSGLLKQHQTRDRKAVGEACLAALEQWSGGLWGSQRARSGSLSNQSRSSSLAYKIGATSKMLGRG